MKEEIIKYKNGIYCYEFMVVHWVDIITHIIDIIDMIDIHFIFIFYRHW